MLENETIHFLFFYFYFSLLILYYRFDSPFSNNHINMNAGHRTGRNTGHAFFLIVYFDMVICIMGFEYFK